MAKKKKLEKVEEKQTFSYEGTLKVTTMHGHRIVKVAEYKNNGLPSLFKFLILALGDNYSNALKPVKIKLFKVTNTEKVTAENFRWNDWNTDGTKEYLKEASSFIIYDVSPVIKEVLNKDEQKKLLDNYHYEVTYHFRIPSSYISEDEIYFAGLYSNNATDNKEACAFYKFTKTEESKKIIWDPVKLSEGSADYSIIVEWTMAVINN